MSIETEHISMDYPYFSKSSLVYAFEGCPYRFKRRFIDNVTYIGGEASTEAADSGSSLHLIFAKLFSKIDYDHLYELDWRSNSDTFYSEVFQEFYRICLKMLEEYGLDTNPYYRSQVASVCRFYENYWYNLRETYTRKSQVIDYFRPTKVQIEYFLKDDELMICGSPDRIIENEYGITLIDYKTGYVNVPTIRDNTLIPKHVHEGNFYCMLYLCTHGYYFAKENDTWLLYSRMTRKPIKTDRIKYAFLFTNVEKIPKPLPNYIYIEKKFNMRTISTLLNRMEDIRTGKANLERKPWMDMCLKCEFFEPECKSVLDFGVLGDIRGSENSKEENIPDV